MKELDKFLQDKTELNYTIKGKEIKGDVSAMNLLKISDMSKKGIDNDSEAMAYTLDIIFGEENGKYLIDNLNIQGLTEVSLDIAKCFGALVDEKEKK